MKKIKYIGFYNTIDNANENRLSVMSATNKMDYIVTKLNELDWMVDLISPSWTNNKKYYHGKKIQIQKNKTLILPPTLPWIKFLKVFSIVTSQIWLLLYLLLYARRNESIIVYHSLLLMYPVYLAKKIKGFRLILEVEEIYQDVRKTSKIHSKMEYKVIDLADGYIFPTELLNKKLNNLDKPNTIIYGTYQVEHVRKRKFKDDKIHVVYAGTFDPLKGGITAVKAAEYLNENYHIHVIGFGSREQTRDIKEVILKINKTSNCKITFDGLLKGEEYITFLQSCDIGLSPQMPDANFNNTSFPSKILSYLANGLRVLSVRLKAIEHSTIGDILYYYDNQSAQSIAEALMLIDVKKPYNSRKLIEKLDQEFTANLKGMLENVKKN